MPPAEQDMREVGLPAVEGGAEPGGSARCPQRRVSRACCPQIPVLGPAGRSFLLRFELVQQTSGGQSVVGVGHGRRVSRRRGCGCATGSTGCFMRCRCGSCPRRRTGRPRCAGGGCRWCRCWTNRTAAGVRRVWPRRPRRQGAAGNGGGTDVGEARGRDEQRPGVRAGCPGRGGGLGRRRRAASRCGCG